MFLFFVLPKITPSYPQKYTGQVKILMNDLPGKVIYYNKYGKFYYVQYADKVGHIEDVRLKEEDLNYWNEK